MSKDKIIVRFAPSPTGLLHLGGLRTALFNFLFARQHEGKFILRIEDTDKNREIPGAVENIKDTLDTFQINYDEGPIFQSQRLTIYRQHAERLLKEGKAYKCYCSETRLEELKKQAKLAKQPYCYDKHCLVHPVTKNGPYVIRQNIPECGETEFTDLVYGKITINNRLLDHGILLKSDGYPVYNFANVIDDHHMGVTHVIRGEEFISSTPKHILLYEALGWPVPQFAHLPLLLDKQHKKLSKRSGDAAVQDYLRRGYIPEAIINFLAFLGWNPKTSREIFSLKELVTEFDLRKINKAGAIFDLDKLNWYNAHYLRAKTNAELVKLCVPFWQINIDKYAPDFLEKIIEIEKSRLVTLSGIGERTGYFFEDPDYQANLLPWKNMAFPQIKDALKFSEKILDSVEGAMSESELQQMFFEKIGKGDKGEILWPLRVALTGLKASPNPFEIMAAFLILPDGKDIIKKRIAFALEKIGKM